MVMKQRTEERMDQDLAFLLQYENIAWYEDGVVKILDRRIYPIRVEHVICKTYAEVAEAIRQMVTQSEGPYIAAAMGMVLAVQEVKDRTKETILAQSDEAAYALSHARPTTSRQMQAVVNDARQVIRDALAEGCFGQALVEAVHAYALHYLNEKYQRYTRIGQRMEELLPQRATILTQCFPGTIVGTMLRACRQKGKEVILYCAETRPYFQGARLTASVACDMGADVTVISDNMPAYVLMNKDVDVFLSASDVITRDGHVINKIGTFQIALAARYSNVPYYVTGTPDPQHRDTSQIVIEERDPRLVTESMGQKITMEGVKGYYPAFDITPPEFVSGVVTEKGVLSPYELDRYFDE